MIQLIYPLAKNRQEIPWVHDPNCVMYRRWVL